MRHTIGIRSRQNTGRIAAISKTQIQARDSIPIGHVGERLRFSRLFPPCQGPMVVVRDGAVGTAETTLGEAGHAAHIRLFQGHSVGIWATNRHSTGTFEAENCALRGPERRPAGTKLLT